MEKPDPKDEIKAEIAEIEKEMFSDVKRMA